MKRMSRIICLMTLVSILSTATSSFASDNTFKEVFQDAFYGGAVGALVGAAFMAFTKKPADHLENIGYGAAVGVLGGAAYGITKSARSLAEIDNGRVRIAMPTIIPDLVESSSNKQTTITWRAELLRGTFN
ncbi:MAG: hypothetical protein A2X83_04575 [Desulfuromonadales bacterium GWD2_54_10]|nr:MAG: hypothetical protein A2X83_04575 [Desulfuromonadales bacterium GWD2_54_10]